MTQPEFDLYLTHLIPDYAADNVHAGHWDESEALEKSRQQIESLLPQGLQTRDHYNYTLVDGDQAVGELHHGECYFEKHRCIRENVTFR